MTVRRINVSQINGNDANADEPNEIRPYGEMGLYTGDYIQALGDDRLELLIHDGKRTHLNSKVLSPGIFYGYGADSGDGYGFDTIKLIPDASMHYNGGSYSNDQYLIVDPTWPNHIHIRAGGTIDNSNAQLYLGGETSHFSVGSGSAPTVYIKSNDHQWTYGTDGALTFPDTSTQTTAYAPVADSWTVSAGTNNYSFEVTQNGTYVLWVRGNIPNGIIVWNATVTITNSNVPVVGQQFAWNYTGAGSPLLLTSIPDQITGTAGSISTDNNYTGNTSNVFVFGISNTSGSDQVVHYGYTKI